MSRCIKKCKNIDIKKSDHSGNLTSDFEIREPLNQNIKDFYNANELDEKIDYYYQLLNDNKLKQNESQKIKEYLLELLDQKIKKNEILNKEDHNKIIEEMNFKIEQEIIKTNNRKGNLINNENRIIKEKYKSTNKTKKISITNIEIPEGTHTWRNQKLAKVGSIFTDDLFPPSKHNLCKLDSSGNWEFPEYADENDLKNWENIKWERVENIFMSSDYQVFYDKIEKEDIIQGSLGNCYFLSAVASLCKYPNLIKKLFFFKEKSDEHCYGCYFRINGIWKLVLLDDFIPCYERGLYEKEFAFTYTNGNELWVILLEKAWAKLNGNYARIIGGDPHEIFEVLTNAYSEKFNFKNEDMEKIWSKYKNAQEKGFLMTAGTSCDEDLPLEEMGLVPGHAYTVVKVVEILNGSNKEKLINLRNPWGHKEWAGDWSDSSNKWTKDIRIQCHNYDVKDDGSFWMSFEDFIKYFIIGGICHLYQDYHYSFIHIFKESTVEGAIISKLTINENNTHCFLMAHQKNPRVILREGQYQSPVLFYLILINSKFEYISSSYGQNHNITIEIVLDKGIYYLISDINYRYVQKDIHGYTLSCYSSFPFEIRLEDKLNKEILFKTSLLSYSKKNLKPKKMKGGLLYKIKKINKAFPFSFILFDNSKGNKEVLISDLIIIEGEKNVSYYFEKNNNDNFLISKTIIPGKWDIFCCMPFKLGASYSIRLKAFVKEYNDFPKELTIPILEEKVIKMYSKLYNDIYKEDYQALDDANFIRQYIYIDKNAYYIGFENISTKKVNIHAMLKSKNDIDKANLNIITFDILPKNRKIFLLNDKNNFFGEISLSFDIHFEEK